MAQPHRERVAPVGLSGVSAEEKLPRTHARWSSRSRGRFGSEGGSDDEGALGGRGEARLLM
eukprot:7291512-Pyramimonas_sp.AAC.1